MDKVPFTLQEAILYFSDYQNCHDFMVKLRWPDGKVRCPRCGSENVAWLPNARVFKCYMKHDRVKFSLKVGTIFEDSPIPLEKWLPVMWMLVNAKNGISSWEIHRAIGVTQKTAWFMLQRCRLAMQDEHSGGKLGGEVEIDETFIGGKARNMHKGRKLKALGGKGGGTSGKIGVQGMLQRGGKVRTEIIPNSRYGTVVPNIWKHVEFGAQVFTDELSAYSGLRAEYIHNVINHAVSYVEGNVHTNGMENFWSLLKRTLGGTYVSVEPFHLFRYVDEQAFRFNNRKPMDDGHRFQYAMRKIVGKRLTYDQLTGKTDPENRPQPETVEPF
ncbi:MAG TPA: IS1595 family transposase [Bryobacteraceae bacterium]|nr:IS1595 family transposase [Bryobacteraceae bacterium]